MLYTNDQVQDMLTQVKNDPKLKAAVLKCFARSPMDQSAVADVISSGWVERFDRYDSAVCDDFIRAWEKCTGKTIKESNGMKKYELELEFNVSFNKELSDAQLKNVQDYLNSFFGSSEVVPGDVIGLNSCTGVPGHAVVSDNDIDWKKQSIYLLIYYTFEGKIIFSPDEVYGPAWEFEGAPSSEDEGRFIQSIMAIVANAPECSLVPEDVNVSFAGKSIDTLIDDIVEHVAIGEYETVSRAVGKILEGAEIRKILI